MSNQGVIEAVGTVRECLPGATFRVEVLGIKTDKTEENPNGIIEGAFEAGYEILATASGKIRKFRVRIIPGDRVQVEISPYDLTKGRIVYREKD